MFYSDDPVRDYERYSARQQRELDRLPVCSECDNPIQTEKLFLINDNFICPHCMKENYMRDTDDYVD